MLIIYKWFRSVYTIVVITSALHAEGHEFEPRRNLIFIIFHIFQTTYIYIEYIIIFYI